MKELIEQTKRDLDRAINHFNNIVDDDLAEVYINQISYLEERLNIFYKIAKRKDA